MAAKKLAASDPDLARILKQYGVPPLWEREPGFATLVYIILEQQVSLASAKAAFHRLQAALGFVSPDHFLSLDNVELKAIGFSRQKMLYTRLLAEAVLDRQIDLDSLHELSDDEVRATLKQLKGIGDWTADVYLLMALGRPDIWPRGDLGLLVAMQKLKQLPARPTADEFALLGEPWKPFRAVAARMLWHFYLSS
ncbi:MAG TPA: DNA-3-methyladenine glycosylase 2 family protein [Blastocatellia bacterium]|nr:DNA-3-methyladenine glycosylase 2 family protein [Blastocatellia bacterium]